MVFLRSNRNHLKIIYILICEYEPIRHTPFKTCTAITRCIFTHRKTFATGDQGVFCLTDKNLDVELYYLYEE